jgi:hypothetical protein
VTPLDPPADRPTSDEQARLARWTAARRPLFVAALALVVFLTAWISRVREGKRALAACDEALVRADRVEAIVFARAAAEARCPTCASAELGYARLYAIAKDAEARGDDAEAVAAWRAVRAAALGSVVIDRAPARRERADVEIARLEHKIDVAAAAAGGTPSPAATEERLRAALAASSVPSSAVFAFLTLGGALFFAGAARFARAKAFSYDELAIAAIGVALAAVGVLLF